MNPQDQTKQTVAEMIAAFEEAYGHHFTKKEREAVERAVDAEPAKRPMKVPPDQMMPPAWLKDQQQNGIGSPGRDLMNRLQADDAMRAANPAPTRREEYAGAPQPRQPRLQNLPSDLFRANAFDRSVESGTDPIDAINEWRPASKTLGWLMDPGAMSGVNVRRGIEEGDPVRVAAGAVPMALSALPVAAASRGLIGSSAAATNNALFGTAPRAAGTMAGVGGMTAYPDAARADTGGASGAGLSTAEILALMAGGGVAAKLGYDGVRAGINRLRTPAAASQPMVGPSWQRVPQSTVSVAERSEEEMRKAAVRIPEWQVREGQEFRSRFEPMQPGSRLPSPNAFDDATRANSDFRRAYRDEVGFTTGARPPGSPLPGNPYINRSAGVREVEAVRRTAETEAKAAERARIQGQTEARDALPGPSGLSPRDRRAQIAADDNTDRIAKSLVPHLQAAEKAAIDKGMSESAAGAEQMRRFAEYFGQLAQKRGGKGGLTEQEADNIVGAMRRNGYNFEPFAHHRFQDRIERGQFGPMNANTRTIWESIKRTVPKGEAPKTVQAPDMGDTP